MNFMHFQENGSTESEAFMYFGSDGLPIVADFKRAKGLTAVRAPSRGNSCIEANEYSAVVEAFEALGSTGPGLIDRITYFSDFLRNQMMASDGRGDFVERIRDAGLSCSAAKLPRILAILHDYTSSDPLRDKGVFRVGSMNVAYPLMSPANLTRLMNTASLDAANKFGEVWGRVSKQLAGDVSVDLRSVAVELQTITGQTLQDEQIAAALPLIRAITQSQKARSAEFSLV